MFSTLLELKTNSTFMKNLLFCLIALTFISWTKPEWEILTSLEGRFSVVVPGEMRENVNSVETPIGTLTYHSFIYEPKAKDADNLAYIISYCDYPEYSIHSDSTTLLEEFYKATIETSIQSVKGELVYDSETEIDGYAGKIWRVSYGLEGSASIKTQACVAENRYYSIQTISLKNKILNPSIDKFMDSFRIISPDTE